MSSSEIDDSKYYFTCSCCRGRERPAMTSSIVFAGNHAIPLEETVLRYCRDCTAYLIAILPSITAAYLHDQGQNNVAHI